MSLRFEWHPAKNVANKRNHGVSFEEAQTVFYDDEAIMINDPEHSKAEHRFASERPAVGQTKKSTP